MDALSRASAGPVRVDMSASTRNTDAAEANTPITGLAYSTDDGATWTDAPVAADGSATVDVPATASFVSLRVTAAPRQTRRPPPVRRSSPTSSRAGPWAATRSPVRGKWRRGRSRRTADGGSLVDVHAARTVPVLRDARLTANAAPEPVKKGKTLTVTGKLSRADWETSGGYGAYTGQKVKLQFRKKGASAYTTVKSVITDGSGNLKATVKAATDGYWRYSFAATSTTTAAVNATGDYVDVR
ncbi:calcium-binding protein [Streptomyces sp. DSM 40484]|uniref:calcium-binding protein n=1 Tax=Streptomyces kroppenstedtii TaxID=3051181 RepID=UPI0028CFEBB7|nr:calcium-binding protein [Streptomyces sp. DSM 40484]